MRLMTRIAVLWAFDSLKTHLSNIFFTLVFVVVHDTFDVVFQIIRPNGRIYVQEKCSVHYVEILKRGRKKNS